MKHTIVSLSCAAALVASLVACSSGDDTSTLPSTTSGSTPSPTTTSLPVTTPPTASATTGSGPVALDARSTYTFGGLKLIVNLPDDIPAASRPSMRLISEFLQGVGRTMARNKLDPSLSGLASANVVKYVSTFTEGGSVQGSGTVMFTISDAETGSSGYTLITLCLDQSKLVQVRKDGSRFVDAATRRSPTLKMTADINRVKTSREVTTFTVAGGPC